MIVFIALALYMLIQLTFVMRHDGDTKERFAGFYAEPKNSIDVLVIGSSAVHPYYSAPLIWEEFNVTSYPLASSSQSPQAIQFLIEEGKKHQNPQVVVIDVRLFQYPYEDRLSHEVNLHEVIDGLTYSYNRFDMINHMIPDKAKHLEYYFDIIKYHSNWKTGFNKNSFQYVNFNRKSDLKGFIPVATHEYFDVPDFDNSKVSPIPAASEVVLRSLLEYCQTQDTPIQFILSPSIITQQDIEKHSYIGSIIQEAGFPFLDCNLKYNEIGIDFSRDLYDNNHLNVEGAEKYSKFIGEYLKDTYSLNRIHDTKVTEDWDTAYLAWLDSFSSKKIELENNILVEQQ